MGGQESGFAKSVTSMSAHQISVMITLVGLSGFMLWSFQGRLRGCITDGRNAQSTARGVSYAIGLSMFLFTAPPFFLLEALSDDLLSHENFPGLENLFFFQFIAF